MKPCQILVQHSANRGARIGATSLVVIYSIWCGYIAPPNRGGEGGDRNFFLFPMVVSTSGGEGGGGSTLCSKSVVDPE